MYFPVMEKPLVQGTFMMEKFPGKGGWTFIALPQVPPDKRAPFGWRKVKGTIDSYVLKSYRLMPMGDGRLFFPIKAALRKQLGKQAGDSVTVVLYADNTPQEIPTELLTCLEQDPPVLKKFLALSEGKQKNYIDWIYDAKTDDVRVERIVKLMKEM